MTRLRAWSWASAGTQNAQNRPTAAAVGSSHASANRAIPPVSEDRNSLIVRQVTGLGQFRRTAAGRAAAEAAAAAALAALEELGSQ